MGRKPSVNLNLPPRMRAARQKSGTVYYYFDLGGKPRKWTPLGSDYVAAVRKWAELNTSPNPVLPTVAYAVARYLASPGYARLSTGTQADYGFALDKIVEHFGDAPLDQVRSSHLTLYLEKRSKESRHRAQREVAVMGTLFRYARSIDLTKNDPKEAVVMHKLPGRKAVVITDEMLDAVYAKGSIALQDAMDLAYYVGQRPADALKLSDTDIKGGILAFRQNKTDKPMRFEVVGELAAVIDRIQARKRTYSMVHMALLVDERGKKMTKAKLRARFEAARKAAGIAGADFQFRDLRRKGGTDLRLQKGKQAAQDLLGHDTPAMTEHYTGAVGDLVSQLPSRSTK